MRLITEYGNSKAYLLANNSSAQKFAKPIIDSFFEKENDNFIFIFYNVKKNITLLHFRRIAPGTSFDQAIQLVKKDILNGDLCSDDKNLQKALNDPHATTAKFLLEFIATEE